MNFKLVKLRYNDCCVFQPAFGCLQPPKAGLNTQQMMSKCCLYDNFMMPFCCLLLSLRFFPIVLIFFTLLNDIAKNKNKNYGYKHLLIFDLWFPHFSNIPKNCKNLKRKYFFILLCNKNTNVVQKSISLWRVILYSTGMKRTDNWKIS